MVDQGDGGSLIAISSTAGRKGLPGLAAYTASKHGLVGLVRSAAIELGPYGIRVNSIHPGNVATKMGGGPPMERLLAENPSYQMSFHTLLASPEQQSPADISAAVVYLASDAARCITGAQIPVDRGATAY
jgi:NAD(P)-dependent dehydrogenase (short-subunit alcohol dehydrogenase family)